MSTRDPQLFAEIFPILADRLPPLTAYRVHSSGGALGAAEERGLGLLLADALRAEFPGSWLWLNRRIVTDAPQNPVRLIMLLDRIRGQYGELLIRVDAIEEDVSWHPTSDVLAEYVVRGPLAALDPAIRAALAKTTFDLRNSYVERDYRIRAWDVDGQPAVSIGVLSRVIYEPDLQAYAESLAQIHDLAGLWVADKTSALVGELVKIVGPLAEHRAHLLTLTDRDVMRQIIQSAPDDHWVVRVASGWGEYDYVTDALQLLVRLSDVERFDTPPEQVERALHLKPAARAQMVKIVSDVIKDAGLIGSSFSTQTAPELFLQAAAPIELRFGEGRVRPFDPRQSGHDAAALGLHTRLEHFERAPLRVTVINALTDEVDDFMEALGRSSQRDFGIALEIVRERKMRVLSPANLESAARLLQKEAADVLLAFLPETDTAHEEETLTARDVETQTIGRGIPALIIAPAQMHDPEAMPGIIAGLLARAGNTPYLLAEPLPFADRVVGLDIIDQPRRDGDHLTGMARLHQSDGTLLRSVIAETQIGKGHSIPLDFLADLLPADLLERQRIVLHYNGRLRRDLLRALGTWEDELNATFHIVELLRQMVPRVYSFAGGKVGTPPWGAQIHINEREALLVTARGADEVAPMPLHLRGDGELPIDSIVRSVLAFHVLHFGAQIAPALPITLSHADAIAAAALRGLLPANSQGSIPFWL